MKRGKLYIGNRKDAQICSLYWTKTGYPVQTFSCSKATIETLEKGMEYV